MRNQLSQLSRGARGNSERFICAPQPHCKPSTVHTVPVNIKQNAHTGQALLHHCLSSRATSHGPWPLRFLTHWYLFASAEGEACGCQQPRRWLERCQRWKTSAVWKLRRKSVSDVWAQCVRIINRSDQSVRCNWQQLQVKGQKGRCKQDFY